MTETELGAYGISSSTLRANDKLTIEFTPKRKHVLNVEKDRFLTIAMNERGIIG